MRDGAPGADDDISIETAFKALEQAIAALPMPFSVFDADDRLIACSDTYRGQYGALLKDRDSSLLTIQRWCHKFFARSCAASCAAISGVSQPYSSANISPKWVKSIRMSSPRERSGGSVSFIAASRK